MITLTKLTLNQSDLEKFGPQDLSIYVALGHAFNEIIILRKQSMLASNSIKTKDHLELPFSAMAVLNMKLLAGRIHENWRFLSSKALKKYMKDVSQSEKSGIRPIDYLRSYFGKTNAISTIRNKTAFHWDHAHLEKASKQIGKEREAVDFFCEDEGNIFFGSGLLLDVIIIKEIYGAKSISESLDKMLDDVLEVSGKMLDLMAQISLMILRKIGIVDAADYRFTRISLDSCPGLEQAVTHYFLDTENVKAAFRTA